MYKQLNSCSAKISCDEKLCTGCIELGLWVPLQHAETDDHGIDLSGLYSCHKCISTTMNQGSVEQLKIHKNGSAKQAKQAKKRKRTFASIANRKQTGEKGGSAASILTAKSMAVDEMDLWMCRCCTFANNSKFSQCKICSASKPIQGSSRRPKANRTAQLNTMYGYNVPPPLKRRKKATGMEGGIVVVVVFGGGDCKLGD